MSYNPLLHTTDPVDPLMKSKSKHPLRPPCLNLTIYGYDHKNMREAKIMEKKENDILFKVKELIVN